jgi:exodeoxyribonuclease V gamma subunit
MPLHLHRAQRSDALVSGLADVLADPLDDPMATEIVAVPAKGIERWITQRLAHRLGMTDGDDGVSANVDFSAPGRLVARTLSVAGGVDPDTDPWEVDRLSWPLLSVIDESVGDPAFAALADHLGAAGSAAPGGDRIDDRRTELRRARRLSVARRLAGLFDDYSVHRPTVLQAWANGEDSDGAGEPLARQRRWQAELFRRVRARIGVPSPAERLPGVFDTLLTNPNIVDLPSRFSVFGATRLSTRELGVLDALAHRRDVHIWIPQPSPKLWASLGGEVADHRLVRRRVDPTAGRPLHPLLRSLGRDSRELQLRLRSCRAPVVDTLHPDIATAPVGALSILQRHLAEDVRPPGAPIAGEPDARELLPADDRSIQVHACHGRDRQVEVLRDVLVGLLADDETLQPRDILVMCPDIELYAPLILAAFGAPGSTGELVGGGSHPGTRIRVRLADRALRRTNPVLDVLARVLELADSRMSASDVLDFADLPPVRRRFGLDDDALQRLRDWVTASGVRWGLNERSRARYGLQALPQNTWRTGLNRILLGVAMSEDEPGYLGLALPLDDVESSDIDLAGRLAELVDRLAISAQQLTGSQSLQAWVTALTDAVDGLASVPVGDSWQREQAHRTLREAVEHAGPQAMSAELRLADVAGLFADALRGRPTRANFRTGELTICSMVPMRSVPHRVICLLGLDDGEFPRTGLIDGDDVLAVDPLVGERDRTSEDRQLTLDAINAATEHLVLLYSGADHRTGAPRPPAAALGEILDVLDASMRTADGPARTQLLIRHPLQPFDDRNFTPGALVAGDAFSFDAAALAGARSGGARRAGSTTSSTLLDRPLPDPPAPRPGEVLELDTLIRFFDHPVKAFLRERLGLAGSWADPPLRDELSVTVDPLVKYAIGDRLLRQRLAGVPATVAKNLEYRRGELPPGRQASTVLAELMADVDGLIQEAGPNTDVLGEQYDVAVPVSAGRTLVGTVGPLRDGVLAATNYSSLSAKHRLQAWIGVLALAAGDPGFVVRGVTIGRGGRGKAAASSRVSAPAAAEAGAILENLVAIRDLGLRMPLPLPPKTACAYVESRLRFDAEPADALDRAAGYWTGGEYTGDGDDAEHRLVFGAVTLPAIAELPHVDAAHRRAGEPTTFGDLAMQIYAPLVRAERLDR